jgi:CubicO group peptidase (beta-lactamase class C family)
MSDFYNTSLSSQPTIAHINVRKYDEERLMLAEKTISYINEQAQVKVQSLLDELVSSELETGVQVAAYLEGKLVVDAWSGVAKPETGEAVNGDTLFLTFSCSKAVTATVIHQLAEAGKLDYDTPVAHYWPEFGTKGKEAITVRHVLTHEAGIPQLPRRITMEQLCDWQRMVHIVENLKPIWTPGTKTGYHGITYGVILGELAQRVDGRPFAQIVQQDVCQPLGVDDLFFGVPRSVESRIATLGGKGVPWAILPPIFLVHRIAPAGVQPNPKWNREDVWRAVIPAGNMITTARALARHYAALCGDGVHGVRLLSPERVRIASALQTDGPDQVFFGQKIHKALGYWLGGDSNEAFGARQTVFGHTGSGGMVGFADPEYKFAFAILKNQMTWRDKDSDFKVAHAVREALGIPD